MGNFKPCGRGFGKKLRGVTLVKKEKSHRKFKRFGMESEKENFENMGKKEGTPRRTKRASAEKRASGAFRNLVGGVLKERTNPQGGGLREGETS